MRPVYQTIIFLSSLTLLFYYTFHNDPQPETQEITTITTNALITKQAKNSDLPKYRVVIAITSQPGNYELRRILREKSWVRYAREKYPEVLVKFLIKYTSDQSIIDQTKYEDDIIWTMDGGSFQILTFFNWVNNMEDNYDKQFDWVMKISENSWINIDLVYKELGTLSPRTKHVWGRFFKNNKRVDAVEDSHSDLDWSASFYPKYPSGTGYAISLDLVRWLSEQWEGGWFWNWKNDDAGIGIYLAALFPDMTTDPRFTPFDSCENHSLLLFPQNSDAMVTSQSNWEKCQNPCQC
eukprot:TRINITY_DN2792_c0_g1_i1.p1 TRINITY_DN2792_c0_g1~~TRINITY_DN2792_c0_g1_i1.p1  ORF type:complete len:294 (-),score=40.56 TRINITY_DN2792_c0_g1_i1:39-920(-)